MKECLGYSEAHTLPLNTSLTEVLMAIQGKEFIWYPSPINSPPNTCSSKKYCLPHKDIWHDIKDYYILNKEIETLIAKCYLCQFKKMIFTPTRKDKSLVIYYGCRTFARAWRRDDPFRSRGFISGSFFCEKRSYHLILWSLENLTGLS